MKEKLLLDTNIFRRLLTDTEYVIEKLDELYISYNFVVSNMSLFEIMDYFCLNKDINERIKDEAIFRSTFNKYKICLLYSKDDLSIIEKYMKYLNNHFSCYQFKTNLLPSFNFTLSKVLTNFFCLSAINIVNSIETDYNSEFYNYVRNISSVSNIDNFYNYYEQNLKQIIIKSYTNNKTKLNNIIKEKFKDLIIKLFVLKEMFDKKLSFSEIEYEKIYGKVKNELKTQSFKDILNSIVIKEKIFITQPEKMNMMDYIFIKNYIIDMNTKNSTFNINDITDYYNYSHAFEKKFLYITLDNKSIKKYKEIFKEYSNTISHLEKCEKIIKEIFN